MNSLFSYQFCDDCKIPLCTYYSEDTEMKIFIFALLKRKSEIIEKSYEFIYSIWK